MEFQPPTTTSASATGISFGLNTAPATADPGAEPFSYAAPAPAANIGDGDADGAKAASPPLSISFEVTTVTAVATPIVSAVPTTSWTGSAFANLSTEPQEIDSSEVANAPQLSFNQLEEDINQCTLELEDQEKFFTEQVAQVNDSDKQTFGHQQNLIELDDELQKIMNAQQMLELDLEFMDTEYNEMEAVLAPLEKELTNVPLVDQVRSQIYPMAENIDVQLKQISGDLKEIIENMNEAKKELGNTDSIVKIGQILDAHVDSVQWVESQSAVLCKKLDDIGKILDSQKRE